MIVTHWSASPLPDCLVDRDQETGFKPNLKPHGFWVSDEKDHGWKSWCEDEGFAINRLAYRTDFRLLISRVLLLDTVEKILAFDDEYRPDKVNYPESLHPDWALVAQRYDGIMITPYQWSLRLDLTWYYGWDCASGCIWRPGRALERSSASLPITA